VSAPDNPGQADVAGASQRTLIAASALIEAKVTGLGGERLGRIAEVMSEAGTGRIAYVVLATGGVLGLGERLHAVPWGVFTIDPDSGGLSLPFDKAAFSGQGFDKDAWPSRPDPRFAGPAPADRDGAAGPGGAGGV
jgi:hypothetical protein